MLGVFLRRVLEDDVDRLVAVGVRPRDAAQSGAEEALGDVGVLGDVVLGGDVA